MTKYIQVAFFFISFLGENVMSTVHAINFVRKKIVFPKSDTLGAFSVLPFGSHDQIYTKTFFPMIFSTRITQGDIHSIALAIPLFPSWVKQRLPTFTVPPSHPLGVFCPFLLPFCHGCCRSSSPLSSLEPLLRLS